MVHAEGKRSARRLLQEYHREVKAGIYDPNHELFTDLSIYDQGRALKKEQLREVAQSAVT